MEDSRIIELFWKRSQQGITELSAKYGSMCENIAINIVGNIEDAKECVNDAYLSLWNAIPPTKPKSLLAFLLKTVRNISINRAKHNNALKRTGNYQECADEFSNCVSNITSPEDTFMMDELNGYINEFLGKLNKSNRYLFVRRYYYMDSYPELSQKTGMKEGAVRTRLARIREKLKKYLEKKGVSL